MKRLMSRLSVHVLLTDSAAEEGEFFTNQVIFLFPISSQTKSQSGLFLRNVSFFVSDFSYFAAINECHFEMVCTYTTSPSLWWYTTITIITITIIVQSLTRGQKVKWRREREILQKKLWGPRLLLVRPRLCVCFSSICEVFSE